MQITENKDEHLKKENDRLRKHLLEIDLQWEETLSELKAENDFLHAENASLKCLVSKNIEAERLNQAMAEMERSYEKQIQALQTTIQKQIIESRLKLLERPQREDVIEKSLIKSLLQILLDKKKRPDAQEQALRVLCEAVGISVPKISLNTTYKDSKVASEDFGKATLSELWIAYLQEKTK